MEPNSHESRAAIVDSEAGRVPFGGHWEVPFGGLGIATDVVRPRGLVAVQNLLRSPIRGLQF